jgi:hypothetical protein
MSDSAKLTSVDAVLAFAAALREFREAAGLILIAHDQNVRRLEQTFAHELPRYWAQRVKHGYDQVDRARSALDACKMRRTHGQPPSCFEEQKAYQTARRRLARLEQMDEVVRHWNIKLSGEIEECRGRLGKFRGVLDIDLEKTIALVDRILTSLEGYLGRSVRDAEQDAAADRKIEEPPPPKHTDPA